jgi:hypothetical protein
MSDEPVRTRKTRPGRAGRSLRIAACALALAACQALPPSVTTALVGFGQDVLGAAAQNFTPQYAGSMQSLLYAIVETATGIPFPQQGGYQGGGGYHDAGDYQQSGEYQGGWDSQQGGASYQEQPYSHQAPPPEATGVSLEVALLAQQRTPDGEVRLRPVNDGDVLYDGRGDPARGDKIKVFFSANCACYVYVIAIDATGYVAQVFPEGDVRAAQRVTPGTKYLVPGGTAWWGLDDYRGIEHIYFIASRERRRDIEDLVAQMAGQRPSLPADYRPVREPAIVAMTRGLVVVQDAAPTAVPNEYGSGQQVTPTLFQSTVENADLVVTRWFRHE